MSKIYQPSMTADDVFNVFQNDPAYKAKVDELQGILKQCDSRVGLVKTQGQADKLMAQAESMMVQAKADAQAVFDGRDDLLEAQTVFAESMKIERGEIEELRKSAQSQSNRTSAKERKINKELDDRETAVENRENRIGERETNMKAAEEAVAAEKKALGAILKSATDGLKTLC